MRHKMKSIITVFLIVSLLTGTYSCQQRKKVELISANNNNEYLYLKKRFDSGDKVKLGIFNFDKNQINKFSKTIDEIKRQLELENKQKSNSFNWIAFEYRLYINENGNIDKIVALTSSSQEIDKLVSEKLSKWNMNIFSKQYPQKYSIDWNFGFSKQKGTENFTLVNSNLPVQESISNEPDDTFFIQVEEMPAPIGGIKGIQEKIHYPELAKRTGIEGRVYIKAYIDKKGNVVKAEIIKGLDGGCNEEALKAVKETKFIPGRQKGKAVNVQVSIPILFKLDSKKENNKK